MHDLQPVLRGRAWKKTAHWMSGRREMSRFFIRGPSIHPGACYLLRQQHSFTLSAFPNTPFLLPTERDAPPLSISRELYFDQPAVISIKSSLYTELIDAGETRRAHQRPSAKAIVVLHLCHERRHNCLFGRIDVRVDIHTGRDIRRITTLPVACGAPQVTWLIWLAWRRPAASQSITTNFLLVLLYYLVFFSCALLFLADSFDNSVTTVKSLIYIFPLSFLDIIIICY